MIESSRGYPATIVESDDGLIVRFQDVPEAITQGQSFGDALENARDALTAALEGYLISGRPFPCASELMPGQVEVEPDLKRLTFWRPSEGAKASRPPQASPELLTQ